MKRKKTFLIPSSALIRVPLWPAQRSLEQTGGSFDVRVPAKAFSLVEVVLALGLVSFAMVAILGLMGLSLNQIRESENDGRLMAMIQHAYGTARVELAREEDFLNPPPPWTGSQRLMYFDNDGSLVASTNAGAIYRVTAVVGGNAPAQIGNTNIPAKALRWLNIRVEWPALAGQTNGFRNTKSHPMLLDNAGFK